MRKRARKPRLKLAIKLFKQKHGHSPATWRELDKAHMYACLDRSLEAYFALKDMYSTRQARQAALEHVEGFRDKPRFKDTETNELLKRNHRRYWCNDYRDKRIAEWIIEHGTRKKYVSAIAAAVNLSETATMKIYEHQIRQAWVGYHENESNRR